MNVFDSIPEDLSIYQLFKLYTKQHNTYILSSNSEKEIVLRHQFNLTEGQYFLKIKIENITTCVYASCVYGYSIDIQLFADKYTIKLSWASTLYDIIHFSNMIQKMHKQIEKTILELDTGTYRYKKMIHNKNISEQGLTVGYMNLHNSQ